jgi:hypothetical protein
MCLRRAPEKYITGAMAPVGAALDRAGVERSECEPVSESVNWSAARKLTSQPQWKTLVVQEGNGMSLRQSPTVSCDK